VLLSTFEVGDLVAAIFPSSKQGLARVPPFLEKATRLRLISPVIGMPTDSYYPVFEFSHQKARKGVGTKPER